MTDVPTSASRADSRRAKVLAMASSTPVMNNAATAGMQTVDWCADDDQNGCGGEWNSSSIEVDWVL